MQSVAPAPLPLQVLLVDDDEDDCTLTSDLVSQIRLPRRAELEWASSYEAGLEALGRKRSDICLLDYRLGARDGLDLLSEARSQGCICPIVILTGQGADGTDTRAMNLGADDYLFKGDLSVPLLERSIRYAVGRAGHLGELRASEIRYRRLFETAKDGILYMTELTGYARQDFLGKHLWEIGPFKDTAASKDSFAELRAKDYVRYEDLPLKTTDGRTVDVEFV